MPNANSCSTISSIARSSNGEAKQAFGSNQKSAASDIAGEKTNNEWTAFAPETGTLGIPRDDMPQIKAEHRGAMTNFMNARGVGHRAEEVPAESLRPTQAEFSSEKVKRAMGFDGGDRSIVVSNDDYVLDGHHQWLAKREAGEPIKIIRLDAPIADLIPMALAFPSSTTTGDTKQGLDAAIKILMDRTDGNGSPDGLIGPENADAGFGRNLRILSSTAVLLMIIHYLGIMLWAGIFLSLPALDKITHWEEAIYFSMVTYTTLGYGDITLPPVWRVMSGFEAMNGILLFGWSTAMFYAVVQKVSTKVNRST